MCQAAPGLPDALQVILDRMFMTDGERRLASAGAVLGGAEAIPPRTPFR